MLHGWDAFALHTAALLQVYDRSDDDDSSMSPEIVVPDYAIVTEIYCENEIDRPLTPVTASVRGYIESVRGYIEQETNQGSPVLAERREDSMESTVWEVHALDPRRLLLPPLRPSLPSVLVSPPPKSSMFCLERSLARCYL